MSIIGQLLEFTEGPWTGIRIIKTNIAASGPPMRLCEAIARSFDQPLLLPSYELSCPGARRSFGLDGDDRSLSTTISQTTGVPATKIRTILVGRPKLSKPVAGLKLGEIEDPEVVVGYVRPLAAMKLLRLWQSRFGGNLTVSLSTFLSICSSVAGVILKPRLVYSLGCPNSREVGGLPPDSVAAILPTKLARVLLEGSAGHANV